MRRVIVLLLAGALLAACGGTTQSTPTAAPSTSPAAGQIVGPVILDAQHTSATVKLGRFLVFKVDAPETWDIAAAPAGILKAQKGYTDGSATFNPGAETVKAGTATVTLTNPSGDRVVFTVTVE